MEVDETLNWEKLKDSFMDRCGGVSDGNVFDQLATLHQEGERVGLHRTIRVAHRSGSAFTKGANMLGTSFMVSRTECVGG